MIKITERELVDFEKEFFNRPETNTERYGQALINKFGKRNNWLPEMTWQLFYEPSWIIGSKLAWTSYVDIGNFQETSA